MSQTVEINPPVPPGSEAEAAAVETVAESAVEIAEIEADRDVTIAAIQAETAETIADHDEEFSEWREELNHVIQSQTSLSGEMEALRTEVATLTATLSILTTPPPDNPVNPAPAPDDAADPEPATTEETEAPPPEPVKPERKRAHRWI